MNNVIISAVICSYNRYETLGAAIESLENQSLDRSGYEILVVDNSPDSEHSAQYGLRYQGRPGMSWINEKTAGLSNARNVGLNNAKGDFVCFMDDDAVADHDWLKHTILAFDMFGERAAAVGGRVEPIWETSRPKWLHDEYLGHLSLLDLKGPVPRILGTQEYLVGTNISFRCAPLRRTGGFSTQLGRKGNGQALLSNEENEVCQKLRAHGEIIIYSPDAIVQHRVDGSRLTQDWFRRRVAWQAVSDFLQDAQRLSEEVPSYWQDVLDFVNRLPPRDRSLRALYARQEDPEMFKMQMTALYNYTAALLTGFRGIIA